MAIQDVELGSPGLSGVRCLDSTLLQFPLLYHEHLPSVTKFFGGSNYGFLFPVLSL